MELRWAVCLHRVCGRSGGQTPVARSQRGGAGRLRSDAGDSPEVGADRMTGVSAGTLLRLSSTAAPGTAAGWLLVEMHLQLRADPAAEAGDAVKARFWGWCGALVL